MIFIALSSISPVVGEAIVQNHNLKLTLNIIDVYYADADSDGTEDDIITHITIDVDIFNPRPKPYKFDIDLKITLPSGIQYTYYYSVYVKRCMLLIGEVYFYNHVTEVGDYFLEVIISMPNSTPGVETCVFDPPGSTGGTDPLGCELYFN